MQFSAKAGKEIANLQRMDEWTIFSRKTKQIGVVKHGENKHRNTMNGMKRSVDFCRESRVEGIMSRVEGKMSRVEGKCRGFKNVAIFFILIKKQTNKQNKTKQNKKH